MKSLLFSLLCGAVVVLNLGGGGIAAQANGDGTQHRTTAGEAPQDGSGTFTLRVMTREILIDVIALRGRDQPVEDLTLADLQVSESSVPPGLDPTDQHKRPRSSAPAEPGTITSLKTVDPNAPQLAGDDSQSGFQISASCLEKSTKHYRLGFRPGPDGWRSGYHMVAISTTRHGVKLFYRHQYYVGLTEPPEKPLALPKADIEKQLAQAACYYPQTPPSISLRARWIDTGRSDVIRYSVGIDADSLSFVSLDGDGAEASIARHVALDYGICNFDNKGHLLNFFHAPLEKVLTSAEYARALDRGFPHVLEFPAPEHIAMTRVVVRDRLTGNLGATDVPYPRPVNALSSDVVSSNDSADATALATKSDLDALRQRGDYQAGEYHGPQLGIPLSQGPLGSFGSIVHTPRSLCGDVYELQHPSLTLPDFRELDPIGSVYAYALDVPNQNFANTTGLPGVTPRTNLFGIDYHGELWIANPGSYEFEMASDDGAILRIDDTKVVDLDGLHMASGHSGKAHLDAGRHSIEVTYYQGACCAVALELWVKPPDARSWTLLDLRDYPALASQADAHR